jgi:hypothetical protein
MIRTLPLLAYTGAIALCAVLHACSAPPVTSRKVHIIDTHDAAQPYALELEERRRLCVSVCKPPCPGCTLEQFGLTATTPLAAAATPEHP